MANFKRLEIVGYLKDVDIKIEGLIAQTDDIRIETELRSIQQLILGALSKIDSNAAEDGEWEPMVTEIVDWFLRFYAIQEIMKM